MDLPYLTADYASYGHNIGATLGNRFKCKP